MLSRMSAAYHARKTRVGFAAGTLVDPTHGAEAQLSRSGVRTINNCLAERAAVASAGQGLWVWGFAQGIEAIAVNRQLEVSRAAVKALFGL